ncbi:DUF1877 family protein [Fusobacterium periodonticum]|uniref:DUF1877 domain-containing protein n=1 Tax=Fusobacterium periodonticum 1_1_41FAA TaxID=469621 RepID=D6LDI4_9FUSO|nr:DUF1877 family protein [Fusobacterium periodonticum]EFG29674.1 hypothetical protein HMPREF0400_02330 [Fusobacterium periodonticum 1_1_41FAA]
MGMDLCYYGVKEENIPDILDGNFFEEDFSDSEPQHTLRVFSVKELYYVYSGRKELEEEDFQGKNERDLFIEAFLGEVTVSSPPKDIYSYCTCKEKVKEIANFLNKIDIKDCFEKIEKFYSSSEEEDYIFDIENIIDRFNDFKEFYNELVKNDLGVFIYIS